LFRAAYTTAIHTLSLHDALPISIAEGGSADVGRAIRIAEEVLPHGSKVIAALRSGLAVHHAQLPRAFLREVDRLISLSIVRVVVDRKSTRLNSSHVKISYAVFCL